MKLFTSIFLLIASLVILACNKKTPPPPPVLVDERVEITPESQAVLVGNDVKFMASMFDENGVESEMQPEFTWSSSDESIATISSDGFATGVSAGQVEITAQYSNLTATALLNVVENSNDLASVSINSSTTFLLLNGTAQLSANGRDINNNIISSISDFTWQSNNESVISVSSNGLITGLNYGSANITATAEGIQSAPLMVSVGRQGSFTGRNGYNAGGSTILSEIDGTLRLEFSSDFSVSGGPDLRVYLSNSPTSISGALELALLQSSSGTQIYNLPSDVTITQYRYVIIWCKQFTRLFAEADLGE